jgi:hypothetical protein
MANDTVADVYAAKVERVARALAVALSGSSTPLAGENDWETLRGLARAAIEAMEQTVEAKNEKALASLATCMESLRRSGFR